MMIDTSATQPVSQVNIERADNFVLLYANNVVVDATAWDMKLTFGRFDEINGLPGNKQQAAVTIPFGVAKLMLYWMEASIIAHELESGHRVGIRESALPPPPKPLTPEEASDPNLVKFNDALIMLREKLIASAA